MKLTISSYILHSIMQKKRLSYSPIIYLNYKTFWYAYILDYNVNRHSAITSMYNFSNFSHFKLTLWHYIAWLCWRVVKKLLTHFKVTLLSNCVYRKRELTHLNLRQSTLCLLYGRIFFTNANLNWAMTALMMMMMMMMMIMKLNTDHDAPDLKSNRLTSALPSRLALRRFLW